MSEETKKPIDAGKRNRNLVLLFSLLFLLLLGIGALIYKAVESPRTPTQKELTDAYYEAHKHEFYIRAENEPVDARYESDAYDKRVFVKNGAVESSLDESNEGEWCALLPPLASILSLVDATRAGDAAAYNACFTDRYRKVHGDFAPFTPQKIYNIRVERVRNTSDGGEVYALSYYIKDNDGTLRRDIVSDRPRVMYLSMVKSGDGYLVADTDLLFEKR